MKRLILLLPWLCLLAISRAQSNEQRTVDLVGQNQGKENEAAQDSDGRLHPCNLRCEYLRDPMGVETRYGLPRFFWIVTSARRAQRQRAYQILVASSLAKLDSNEGDAWDSDKVLSDETTHIEFKGGALNSAQQLWWKVRSWDEESKKPSAWSTNAFFRMGLLHPEDWTEVSWIGTSGYDRTKPCPVFRSQPFVLTNRILRATAFVSAKGVYELWINGRRIGKNILAPEWTDYRKRIQYQAFDVTSNLFSGAPTATNLVGAMVGEGWCSDAHAFPEMKQASPYGAVCPQLALVIKIVNVDGTETSFATSGQWSCSTNGPIRNSSIYGGETYDANQEGASTNWTWPGTQVLCFTNSIVSSNVVAAQTVAQPNEPIELTRVIQPIDSWANTNSQGRPVIIFDLGQNIVGWCAVSLTNVPGHMGSKVTLRHAERLQLDAGNNVMRHGNIDIHNLEYSLGTALQTDTFILDQAPNQEFHPHFTYHGFRYVEVSVPPGVSAADLAVNGWVIHSGVPETGQFACSDPRVNRLMQNIEWTIRGNLYGVMTDAPQRPEREGYLGSEMLISQTACFDFDLAALYTKWIRDIREAQDASGAYAIYAPWNDNRYSAWDPGWQVGGIFFPWQLYLNYGDTRMLGEHYDSATNWLRYIESACPAPDYVWRSLTNPLPSVAGNNISYGDWLNGDAFLHYPAAWPSGTSHASATKLGGYGTAWAAYSADLVADMARVLEQRAEAKNDVGSAERFRANRRRFSTLAANFRSGFTNDANGFVTHDSEGKIIAVDNNSQGACVGALHFNMVPEQQRSAIAAQLVYGAYGIENYNTNFSPACTNHLSTGNQFAAREMSELTRACYAWKAYEVLTNAEFPGWLYWVENGATTCWERWNTYLPGPGPGRGYADYNEPKYYNQRMSFNSFNSLPFGAVGEWIWEVVGGIKPDVENPGFRNVIIWPQAGGGITWARSSLETIRGPISCSWTNDLEHTNATIDLNIPANATASLYLPTTNLAAITEQGCPAPQVPGLLGCYSTNAPNWDSGVTVLRLGSGHYRFEIAHTTFQVSGPKPREAEFSGLALPRRGRGMSLLTIATLVAAIALLAGWLGIRRFSRGN
jgi:alpha-L-rhamnosidase